VIKHSENCFVHDGGYCDCGVDPSITDEEIDAELLEKEEVKE
jgi:hypothetical protein